MKLGIITFHRALNYGAILQTYALQNILKDKKISCEVIDYRCKPIEMNYKPITVKKIMHIKSFLYMLIHNGLEFKNRKKFRNFLKQHIILSKKVSKKNIEILSNQYDGFVTGSDQVWNCFITSFDKAYFLEFVSDTIPKCSYAASFGINEIPEEYQSEYVQLLNRFNVLTVREQEGARIVKQLIGKEVPVVLDPVLLLNGFRWYQIGSNRLVEENYIVIYFIVESEAMFELARRLSRATGLTIIYISDRITSPKGIRRIKGVGPEEFISLLLHATYIITNSFHGIAFSILFHKEFFVQLLPIPAKVNSRIIDILKLFHLEERIVEDDGEMHTMRKINYSNVNEILDRERKKSFEYLDSIIYGFERIINE